MLVGIKIVLYRGLKYPAYERDRALGYTSIGPQKADLKITLDECRFKMSYQEVSSKLLVCI